MQNQLKCVPENAVLTGWDFSTGAVKCLAFDLDGNVLAETRFPTELAIGPDGSIELNLLQLEGQARQTLREITAKLRELGRLDDWLAGDPKRFEGRFAVTSPAPHTLRLVPCEETLKKLYRSVEIELAPDGASIAAVRLEENTGDRLEIRFLKVKNDPELPQSIWRMPPE